MQFVHLLACILAWVCLHMLLMLVCMCCGHTSSHSWSQCSLLGVVFIPRQLLGCYLDAWRSRNSVHRAPSAHSAKGLLMSHPEESSVVTFGRPTWN